MSDKKLNALRAEAAAAYEERRPVPGLRALRAGTVAPKPYPINIYHLDKDDTSGIAGTLYPDGTFAPLPVQQPPYPTLYWDEAVARKVSGTVVWNGTINGTLVLSDNLDDAPHKRPDDPNSFFDWPANPPRYSKPVNPEKARLAALEERSIA